MGNVIWKDILWPGSWSFPDGRRLVLTAEKIRNALTQGKAMLARGLDVPWCWEHQPDAEPRPVEMSSVVYAHPDKRADWARNVIAPVTDYRLRERNGQPVLEAAFDATRLSPKEIQQIRKCGKVSCRVDANFRDSRDGTVFPGYTVGHIAVTPKPLEPNQGPFLMSSPRSDETYYLGQAGPDMAKEDTDVETPSEVDAEIPPVEAESEPELTVSDIGNVIQALRDAGFNIPDEVMDAQGLVIAIKASGSTNVRTPAPGNASPETEAAPSAPMMMSQAQMAEVRPQVVAGDRRDYTRRISELVKTGRVAPPVAESLKRRFETFELSYGGDGMPHVGTLNVLTELTAYEQLPAGMVMKGKAGTFNLSQTQIVPTPADMDAKTSLETVRAYQAELAAKFSVKS